MKRITDKAMKDMMGMGGVAYAQQEAWDIQNAASVLSQLGYMCINEADEPSDIKELAGIMRSLMTFIEGELAEMEKASRRGEGYEKSKGGQVKGITSEKEYKERFIPAQVKDTESVFNLSYVKSLGLSKVPDLACKFVAKDQIKGYAILWGDESKVDLEKEYFTKSTNFWDNQPQWLTWDHAQDDEFKSDPRIGTILEVGDDEWGKWYLAKLKTAEAYRKYLDDLIEKKSIGSSSDSAPQYVKRVKTGKSIWLAEWPLFAVSLTDAPCEPRMIGSLEFLKSLGVVLPDVNDSLSRFNYKKRQAELLNLKIKVGTK
jgi:hypothetical protein